MLDTFYRTGEVNICICSVIFLSQCLATLQKSQCLTTSHTNHYITHKAGIGFLLECNQKLITIVSFSFPTTILNLQLYHPKTSTTTLSGTFSLTIMT